MFWFGFAAFIHGIALLLAAKAIANECGLYVGLQQTKQTKQLLAINDLRLQLNGNQFITQQWLFCHLIAERKQSNCGKQINAKQPFNAAQFITVS